MIVIVRAPGVLPFALSVGPTIALVALAGAVADNVLYWVGRRIAEIDRILPWVESPVTVAAKGEVSSRRKAMEFTKYSLLQRSVYGCCDQGADAWPNPVLRQVRICERDTDCVRFTHHPMRAVGEAGDNCRTERPRSVQGTTSIEYREKLACEQRQTDTNLE
jgi:hypothetical protein